ncbi:MAG: DUF3417 domain-containing protein, partial [Betaproteobacteria bacterium]|nr:DUF3417 domain-containing protein [Betaproteobacteria bacterium]
LLYRPATERGRRLAADGGAAARQLAEWRVKVRAAWPGVVLRRTGEPPLRVEHGERVKVAVAARLNGLAPEDLALELVLRRPALSGPAAHYRFTPQGTLPEGGEHLYQLEFEPEQNGRLEYQLRAYPSHEQLAHPFETGLMIWL